MIKGIISAKSFIWILFFSIFFTSNVLADDLDPYVIMGNLRSQAITAKSAENPAYLQPALGQAVLTFIYEGQTYNLTTGLADTQPLVRQKAASLIAELGDPIVDSSLISALQTKLSSESDAQTKGFLFSALTSLQLKAQTSIANKVNFVNTFLATYDPQIQGVEALFSICSQVRDQGLQVASALTIFKNARLAQLPELNTYINDTLTILSLYGQNSGQALYEQAIGNASDGVRLWAINKLVNTNTPEFQVYANNILLKLWKDKSDVFFNLQGAIEKSEILRSENLNSCLEFTSGNALQNWQVTQSDGFSTTAIDTESAYSFAKCLKIINKSGSTLVRSSTAVDFSVGNTIPNNRLPTSIDYGAMYHMAGEQIPTGLIVTVKAYITFADNTTLIEVVQENNPHSFSWEPLNGVYAPTSALKPIKLVQVEAVFSGTNGVVYFDDIYVRRSLDSVNNNPPVIQSISATPQAILLLPYSSNANGPIERSEPVAFGAVVSDPDGDVFITGWESSREGRLGNSENVVFNFTTAGVRTITFAAVDSFGARQEQKTNVDVFRPEVSLVSDVDDSAPVSGNVNFLLTAIRNPPKDNSGSLDSTLPPEFTYSGKIYLEGDREIGIIAKGAPCVVDTRCLPNGITSFYAKVKVYRVGAQPGLTIFNTNNLILNIDNGTNSKDVRITSPSYGTQLITLQPVTVEFAPAQPPTLLVTQVKIIMRSETTGQLFTVGSINSPLPIPNPYTVNLVPTLYSPGRYSLYATVLYQSGSSSSRADSILVSVEIPTIMPPTNLTVQVTANRMAQLSWQDNSRDETGFKIYRKTGDSGDYVFYRSMPANTRTFSEQLAAGAKYWYRVTAVRETLPPIALEQLKQEQTLE